MKRKVTIDKNGYKSTGIWGYVGEQNITDIEIALPDELVPCDFCIAIITNAGRMELTDKLEIIDGKVNVIIPLSCTAAVGKITVQVVGYVMDESEEIYAIGKTAEFEGKIKPSSTGEIVSDSVHVPLLERIWAKIQSWADKIHTHDNKDVLDNITSSSLGDAKVIVENTAVSFSGSLRSDKYYIFVNPAKKIAILSFLNVSNVNVVPEYVFEFKCGDTATRLSLPHDCVWSNNDVPNIRPNRKYIIRVVDNIASYSEVRL